jgi:hypothetical protein
MLWMGSLGFPSSPFPVSRGALSSRNLRSLSEKLETVGHVAVQQFKRKWMGKHDTLFEGSCLWSMHVMAWILVFGSQQDFDHSEDFVSPSTCETAMIAARTDSCLGSTSSCCLSGFKLANARIPIVSERENSFLVHSGMPNRRKCEGRPHDKVSRMRIGSSGNSAAIARPEHEDWIGIWIS